MALNALALAVAQLAHAQTISTCSSCPPELAADPLVAYSLQLADAMALWDQAPPGAVLCVISSGPTSYQFSIVPSAAAAPAAAICLTREGTQLGSSQPLPVPLPPVQVAPPPPGPAQPTPVPDIVIEQPTPTPTPRSQPVTPSPTSSPSSSSPSRRPSTPAPSQPVETVQLTPAPAGRTDPHPPAASSSPVSQPALPDGPSSAPVVDDSGPANTPPNPASPTVRTVPGVLLGTAVFDSFGDGEAADTSGLQAGRLFIGSNLMSLQSSDGTPLSVADLPLRFVLSPDDALLAGSGVEAPFGVFAFNPDGRTFDALPTTVDVHDDGSVSVTVLQLGLAAWPGDTVVAAAQAADATVSSPDTSSPDTSPLGGDSDQDWSDPDGAAAEADAEVDEVVDAEETAGPVATDDASEDTPPDPAGADVSAEG